MEQTLLDEMAADADVGQVTDDKLAQLSKLCIDLKAKERELEELEETLKKKKESYRLISEVEIPDLFDSLHLSQIKLDSGEVVEIKREYAATITEEKKPAAFSWLKNNGHESIIKHDVAVTIKKGETQEYAELLKFVSGLGVSYSDKEYVHPMTLKSFVKEQISAGIDFPQETFSVFPVRKTKIK